MRAVVQRVSQACVRVVEEGQGAREVASIGRGFLVLLGVHSADTEREARVLAEKIAGLRVMEDADGKMNLALADVGGSVLLISNFTLYGDCRKGRRPSFSAAAPPIQAERLYRLFGEALAAQNIPVAWGIFGAHMEVELVNDGPVTFVVEALNGDIV
ncbi:D-tyrosyl-tRNA(Tyr) deacylase [Chthonomonas calidirosea]|uniref:D-aminoacyl-tRNA deacylase n=1 Tax=Chthonomonas calidirosea (strain DSM 23976 / ICMP 18418 / T49) TaxID=1303518 RepID=S0EUJ4_CHTCT|nr:D-aminoacyl-tRNA deacylase [Chthonomonas calidirosea]CCW35327.1 D-tyrosyl-tRNA(Tyr) deacylase [Chthonomonas calidirosea T49]CEK20596.1 D-tyrosyl-tRNA(Tyr) deacylase [Chthonomonas calidirosea]